MIGGFFLVLHDCKQLLDQRPGFRAAVTAKPVARTALSCILAVEQDIHKLWRKDSGAGKTENGYTEVWAITFQSIESERFDFIVVHPRIGAHERLNCRQLALGTTLGDFEQELLSEL